MKTFCLYVAVAVVLLFTSCYSGMKVRVDALNMPAFKASYLYKMEEIERLERYVKNILSGKMDEAVANDITILANYTDTSGIAPDEDKAKLQQYIKQTGEDAYRELASSASNMIAAGIAVRSGKDTGVISRYDNSVAELYAAIGKLKVFQQYCRDIYSEGHYNLSETIAFGRLSASITNLEKGVYGDPITADPMASVVTALPEQYWKVYKKGINLSDGSGDINAQSLGDVSKYVNKKTNRINTTYAKTRFGNSDIAIKMVAPG
jgi:hypothetical protein